MFLEEKRQGEPQVIADELLWKAANEIAQRGHAKRVFVDRRGGVCFIAAMSYASGAHPNRMSWEAIKPSYEKMASYLGRDPIELNNDPATTGDEIVAAMRACALKN